MAGGSKLARRMAYKKQLEEEYRLAAEKIKVKGVIKHSNYNFRFGEYTTFEVVDMERKRMVKVEEVEEEEINVNDKAIEEANRLKERDILRAIEKQNSKERERLRVIEEENQRKESERLRAIEEEILRKERERLRAIEEENLRRERERLRLEELERKRIEDEEAAKAIREAEMLEKLRLEEEQARLAKEELLRMERARKLEEEKKMIEMKELEEIRRLQLEEDSRIEEPKLSPEEEQAIKDLELKEYEEMKKTEERINQLELSIASLDDELERFDIEKMKGKTKKVMKRMSLVITDTTDDELDEILQQTTVNGFMENEVLWGKYLKK